MFSQWLDPLSRPLIVIGLGSLFGLLCALGSLMFPTSIGPAGQSPLLTGFIAAVSAMLLLGMATLIFDAFGLVGEDEDEEPSEEE